MDEEKSTEKSFVIKKIIPVAAFVLAVMFIISIPVFSWFFTQQNLAAYAPVSTPQSLYIGAGHIEFAGGTYYGNTADEDQFEDIRYLYLSGIDVDNNKDYYDYVFCVYGKAVGHFKLQLAYTTNNQFTYQIYNATEKNQSEYDALTSVQQEAYVPYTTHGETPATSATYYYTVNGGAIAGTFFNAKTDGETLGKNATDETSASEADKYHKKTYGSYDNVDKYAEPIYWQTSSGQTGSARGIFINYYILRVNLNGKNSNDRETDVICIAAKSSS